MGPASRQYCTFYLDQCVFRIELTRIQELLPSQEMTPVPLSSSVVRGLINLRGQIVTAIDMRRLLKLGDSKSDEPPMNVVLHDDGEAVSLLVDQIGDVVEVEDHYFEPPPETLQGSIRSLIQGTYKMRKQLMLVLDISKALDVHHEEAA